MTPFQGLNDSGDWCFDPWNVFFISVALFAGWAETIHLWTIIWLSITHTSYAAFDINAGHMSKSLGMPFYFYQRYSELFLHCFIGGLFFRIDHIFLAVWHLWKYVDVTAGGRVRKYPRVAHFLDWFDAAAWSYSSWCFNSTAIPFVFALCTYAAVLQQTWSSGLLGNDSQGSIAYGAALISKKASSSSARSPQASYSLL